MTDFYDNVENALIALLRTELSARYPAPLEQVTKSDDTTLTNGYNYYAFPYPGAFPTIFAGVQLVETSWEILLDIFSRFNSNEAQAWIDFKAYRSDIYNLINLTKKGRTLNRAAFVLEATLSSDDRPRYIPTSVGNDESPPAFIAQTLVVTVRQELPKT